jgi:hypothetical protein
MRRHKLTCFCVPLPLFLPVVAVSSLPHCQRRRLPPAKFPLQMLAYGHLVRGCCECSVWLEAAQCNWVKLLQFPMVTTFPYRSLQNPIFDGCLVHG